MRTILAAAVLVLTVSAAPTFAAGNGGTYSGQNNQQESSKNDNATNRCDNFRGGDDYRYCRFR